ncbi:MAG: cation transporter [Gemmatimonadaceae bacterium]|nr:cation transporter [Gemmatimonadaceae bacterium]
MVADAIESATDSIGSLVVLSGLRIANRSPDDRYPFGYGRAEPLAAATVAALMLGAAAGIAIEAIREIRTPHHSPAAFTHVLAAVIVIKEVLASRVLQGWRGRRQVSWWKRTAGTIVRRHHLRSRVCGISVALIGGQGGTGR